MARFVLLFSLLLAAAANANPIQYVDRAWFSTVDKAHAACLKDGDGYCQPGGGFAYFLNDYWNGPYYFWINCYEPSFIYPYEGVLLGANDPPPLCISDKPDLVPTVSLHDDNAVAGKPMTVSASVTNGGGITFDKTTHLYIVFSSDSHYSNDDTVLAAIAIPPLGPGATDDLGNLSLTIPSGVTAGQYYIVSIVNRDHEGPTEKDYNNNTVASPVTVEAADISIAMSTDAETPITLAPGQELDTSIELKNVSKVAGYPDAVEAGIFLSKDETLDDGDRPIAVLPAQPPMAAGAVADLDTRIKIPDDTLKGDYYLIAVANPKQYFEHLNQQATDPTEQSYENNIDALKIDVEPLKVEIEVCVGNPISTTSGRKLEKETDYRGSGPFPLEFARYYSSAPGNLEGWTTSYSEHLLVNNNSDGTTDVIYVQDNTMRDEFRDIDHQGYSDPDVPGFVTRTSTGFSYLDGNGTLHAFDAEGHLTGLMSRTGFTQTLTWSNGELVSITGPFGRSIELDHDNEGRISAMHTPDDAVYRYTYNDKGLLSVVTLPDDTPNDDSDNPTRQYLYESPNLVQGLTGIVDQNGNRYSTFDYDAEGRAILSKHFDNVDATYIAYNGDETTVTNALGKQTTYVFEDILGAKHLVRTDGLASPHCPMTSTTKTYDSRGFPTQAVDANGNITTYTYTHTGLPDDEYLYHVGLPTRRTEGVGTPQERTTTIEWHPQFRLPVKITEPGHVIQLTWDDHGRLTEREETATDTGAQRIWRYTYNDAGLLGQIDGPRTDVNDVTTLAWDGEGDLASVTDALGHPTEILAHDASGLPLTVRDANGLVTHLTYDAQRRLVSQTVDSDAGAATTGIDYDAKGNVVTLHLPDGQTLHYTYDIADRLTTITNDLGESIAFTLDNDGHRTASVTRGADQSIVRTQQRAFDELGRLIETIGAANQTSQIGYDLNGNLDFIQDAMGNATQLGFDGLNRLISVTDALGGESSFTYDGENNLTSVTDADGVTTTYHYDGLGDLTEEDSTASGTTHYTYDAAGNRISKLDANNVEADYSYDALNRLTAVTYPSAPQEDITYHYDEGTNGIGRLTSVDDPSGETHFSYDDRGNLVTDRRTIDGIDQETDYSWSLGGHLTRMTYPSGRIVNYELDALGRVQAITTQANGASPVQTVASDLGYLPFGPADHWIDGNGVATDIRYDEDYRVTAVDAHGASDILSLGYTYNDNSNITGILDKLGIDSQQFGYDKLNRLTSADGQYGAIDYAYDGVGDRTRRTMTKDSATTEEDYSYESGSHRLAAVTATDASGTTERTFSHDANGNTTSDTSPERVLQLVFNARNRLAEVTQDGNVVGQYEYNALGQRVAKTSTYRGRLHAHIDQANKPGKNSGKGNASQSNVHATTDNAPVTEHLQFVYDEHGNLIAESDGEGNVMREYIYLGNYRIAMAASTLDHPETTPSVVSTGSGAATAAERPQPTTLSLYFIHNDHLGTPKVVTDTSQNIVWSMHQTPFGETTLDTEAVRMPMRFPGQYADIESGYNYNYFRDYDPTLGRYVESDPVRLEGGLDRHSYVSDSPITRFDPFGLLNLVATAGGSFVKGFGFEGYVGVYVTLPSPGNYPDLGLLGSGGVAIGYDQSAGAQFGVIKGNENNISGISYNVNAGAGPAGVTLMYDQNWNLIGFTGGPTEEFGGSLTYAHTGAAGLNDLGRWIGRWLYLHLHPDEVLPCIGNSQ